MGPRLRECCRQLEAEIVSSNMNKTRQTWSIDCALPILCRLPYLVCFWVPPLYVDVIIESSQGGFWEALLSFLPCFLLSFCEAPSAMRGRQNERTNHRLNTKNQRNALPLFRSLPSFQRCTGWVAWFSVGLYLSFPLGSECSWVQSGKGWAK